MLTEPTSSSGSVLDSTSDAQTYRPLLELGRGGMARVYLAQRITRGLRKLVVLKALDPSLATDAEMRLAFRREAELCVRLNHPNIVQVFEVIDETATPMIVMEYIDGVSLGHVVSRTDGRLPLRLHIHIIIQVLAGLHYFHELTDDDGSPLHPVHRDVSPQNVLVMHEGVVKVLDFGIAKIRDSALSDMTRAGIIKGKLAYMPGEQLSGDTSIDCRADVFAAGVMLWEAFARRRMWKDKDQNVVVHALVNGEIPPIEETCEWISDVWKNIITRATAGHREGRYASALEMQIAMEDAMVEFGGPVPQRELATFMATEFGAWREERKRLVETECSKPIVPLAAVLGRETSSSIDLVQVTRTPASGSLVSGIEDQRSRRARLSWLLVIALALVVGFVVGWPRRPVAMQSSQVPIPTAKKARLSVAATPAGAEVRVSGRLVGNSPWADSFDSSEIPLEVEVSAPEYEPFRQSVRLNNDITLSITLNRSQPAAAPSANAASAASSSKAQSHGKSFVRLAPAPSATQAASATAKLNCNPPYTLDSQGIRTYRTECL